MLGKIRCDHTYSTSADIIRLLALTGCRRSEIIGLRWDEVAFDGSCLRLAESKEGYSIRPVGLRVLEYLEERHPYADGDYVFTALRNRPVERQSVGLGKSVSVRIELCGRRIIKKNNE